MDIEHKLEFQEGTAKDADKSARELANLYSRVFGTPDGKKVLEDLFRKLDPAQPRFSIDRPNSHSAARIEGRCDVWREIRGAVIVGGGRSIIESLK
jgi:hypothetical protein